MRILNLVVVLLCGFLFGCNNDDLEEVKSENVESYSKVRWYGTKSLKEHISSRGIANNMKLWATGVEPIITVKFLNTPDDVSLIEQIKVYASEWEQYAGVKFDFVDKSEKALVRIAFDWNDNSWLTWSYTGTDAKMVRNQNEPTACFGGLNDGSMTQEEIKGDVLRIFGQILGLEYEQRHMGWDSSWWKKDRNGNYLAQKYWEDMFYDYYEGFDWETIKEYVFDPLSGVSIIQTKELDMESIMNWPNYTRKETTKIIANYELSTMDKEFIVKLYPKKNKIETKEIVVRWLEEETNSMLRDNEIYEFVIGEGNNSIPKEQIFIYNYVLSNVEIDGISTLLLPVDDLVLPLDASTVTLYYRGILQIKSK